MVATQDFKAVKASTVIEEFQMNTYYHGFLQRYDKSNIIKVLGILVELKLP